MDGEGEVVPSCLSTLLADLETLTPLRPLPPSHNAPTAIHFSTPQTSSAATFLMNHAAVGVEAGAVSHAASSTPKPTPVTAAAAAAASSPSSCAETMAMRTSATQVNSLIGESTSMMLSDILGSPDSGVDEDQDGGEAAQTH